MSPLNPILLPGLFLVGAPIIIHLINRNRFEEVQWGAYQLLLTSFQVKARRIRLQEILLLLLRCLLLAFFILALCRYVIQYEGFNWTDPLTSNVIVIDGSYSMERETDEGPLLDKAKKKANEIIDGLRKGEDVSVIVIGRTPERLTTKPEFEFEDIKKEILNHKLRGEAADYVAGLDLTLKVLNETKNPMRRLFIISDLQNNGWRSRDTAKWAYLQAVMDSLELKVNSYYLGQKVESKANFSVSPPRLQGVSVTIFEPARFVFSVKNHHDAPDVVSIVIEKDGKEIDRRERTLDPGETREETFDVQFEKPGPHVLTASVETDFIPGDNRSFMAINVVEEIPLLVIDGTYTEDFFRSSTGFFAAALNPDVQKDSKTAFAIKRIAAKEAGNESLSAYKAIVLANLGAYPESLVVALERYVDQGGGMLISCGSQSQPNDMMKSLYKDGFGLLPAALSSPRKIERQERPFSPFFPKGRSDIFPFLEADEGQRLAEVLLRQFIPADVTEEDLKHGTEVLAELADEKPFLLSRRFGKGRVMLCTTAFDMSWGNFPSQWVYVPLVNHLMLYLSAENQNDHQVIQGDKYILTLPAPEENEQNTIYIRDPGDELIEEEGNRDGKELMLDFAETRKAGVYLVSTDKEFPADATRAFAVNIDLSESELGPIEKDFRELLTEGFEMKFFDEYDEYKKEEEEDGSIDLWRYFILLTIIALIGESIFTAWIASEQEIKPEDFKPVMSD